MEDIRFMSAGRAGCYGGQDRRVHDVELADRTKMVLLDVIVAQISRIPLHVIPAQPGGYMIAGEDEDGSDFIQPIAGWSVALDGNIYPLTADGSIDDLYTDAIVVTPKGEVVRNGIVQNSSAAYKAIGLG